jgi:hypothetical protein
MDLSVCCAGTVMWRAHCVKRASVWTMLYRYLSDRTDSTDSISSRIGLIASSELAKLAVLARVDSDVSDECLRLLGGVSAEGW